MPEATKKTTKKPTAKKAAAKKPATKKTATKAAAKKPAVKKSPAKTTTKKAATKAESVKSPVPAAEATVGSSQVPGNKNTKMIILVGLLIVGLIGAAILSRSGDESIALTTFTAEQDPEFSIQYPEGWEVEAQAGSSAFTEPESETNEYRAKLEVAVTDFSQFGQELSKDEIFEEFKSNAETQFASQSEDEDDYASNIQSEEIKIGDLDALVYSVDLENITGETGESGQGRVAVVYIDSSTVATVFIEAHESDAQYVDLFDTILASFTFK